MLNVDINSICSDKLRKIYLYRCDLSQKHIKGFCDKNPELVSLSLISCNITDINFLYELSEKVCKVDLANNPLKIDDVEKIIKFRREKLPELNISSVDDVIEWHDARGIKLSNFIAKGIDNGFAFEHSFTIFPYKRQMTVNDMITLQEFIDFSREEFQGIERTIYLDENQEVNEEYIEKINLIPINKKTKLALTVEQANKLKDKIRNDCEVQIYCKNVAKLPIAELENLEEGLNITSVQIMEDVHKRYHEAGEWPYTIEKYKACREKINELIEDIDVASCEGKPNRDKILFGIIVKRLSHIVYDYSVLYELKDARRVTSRNLEGGLLDGTCVCAGFAEITKQVLSCLGIEAEYVGGTSAINSEIDAGHAWNQVKLDGVWYNFDLTNCRAAISEGRIPENFFLQSDEKFRWNQEYKRIENKKHECKEDFGLLDTVAYLYGSYQAGELLNAIKTVQKEMYEYFWDYSFTERRFVRNFEDMRKKALLLREIEDLKVHDAIKNLDQDITETEISISAEILKETKKELENVIENQSKNETTIGEED